MTIAKQTQIMKEYPAEFTVVFFYNLFVSIIAAIFTLVVEGASSAWIIHPSIALASILCSVRPKFTLSSVGRATVTDVHDSND